MLADPGAVPELPHSRLKSDYALMLVQCLLGIGIMFFPSVLEKHWKLAITNQMHILFVLFLYCGNVLGEVRSFYYKVPHWDSFLHLFSGAMLGVVGFSFIDTLNDSKSVRVHMTDKFVAVFSFCFALSLGTLWEIYEFTVDSVAALNMQKHASEDGTRIQFTDHQVSVMQTALDQWGVNAQAGQTIEECAEFIVALQKHLNRTPVMGNLENVIDEMADVEMMLAQMRLVFGISDERIQEQIGRKFEKLEQYLNREG